MTGLSVVRFERLRRGIKAKEVAEAAGLTPPKYRFFERGEKYRGLSESALAGISAYLGVMLWKLVNLVRRFALV